MMEHGASESVKEQSQIEMTIKTDVEAAATSTAHIESAIDINHLKQEPGLVKSVKSEPALLVKEEIPEDSSQGGNEEQCVQGASTPAGTGSENEAWSMGFGELLNVKHELEDIDIEPTVLQHVDKHYIINKIDINHLKQEPGLVKSVKSEPALLVKEEIPEDSSQGGNEEQCVQGASTPAGTGSENEAWSMGFGELLNVKHELEHIDIEPTVLQHVDIHYIINKNMSAVAEENTIVDDCNKAMPYNGVKKESVEDKLRDKTISCKYCSQTMTQEDYDELHLKSCHGHQKDINSSGFNICDAKFSGKSHLVNRLPKHTVEKPFQCDTCNARFSRSAKLTIHKRIHTGEKPYQCKTCDARFAQSTYLTIHKRIHTDEKPYRCKTCDARFAQSRYLTTHMRVHTGEKLYQCNICDAKFALSSYLTKHMRVHTSEKPYQCNMCDARFARRSDLTTHMRVHTCEKPYQCNMCDARFARRSDLTTHMRVHTGEKPFRCNTCNARFSRSAKLTIHKRIHTGEKPYQCKTCDARFAQSSYLTTHMRVHTGEKPFHCDTCNARFSRSAQLNIHKRIHTGEKPYQCKTCDARFAQSSYLTTHMRVHTGEKPYQCNISEAKFALSSYLTKHMRVHSGEKPTSVTCVMQDLQG